MTQLPLEAVLDGQDLTPETMGEAMEWIMSGLADPVQVGGFLCALRSKGETPEEIAAAARTLRQLAHSPSPRPTGALIDTCGTGGDGMDTPNISTMVALVAAAGGLSVAKHGNRSVSSRCGSADLLEALGIPLEVGEEALLGCLEEVGITFLYAPRFHPAMRHAGPIRRALGVRTLFNILGPLANPLAASHQVLGVFRADLTRVMAETLSLLGVTRALVVHGEDGMDELTTVAPTRGYLLEAGRVEPFRIDPTDLGFAPPSPEDLRSGGPPENAAIAEAVLKGQGSPAVRDLVVLNAGAALWIGERCPSLVDGVARARELLDSGAPWQVVEAWRAYLGAA